jgi:hypothetical protein
MMGVINRSCDVSRFPLKQTPIIYLNIIKMKLLALALFCCALLSQASRLPHSLLADIHSEGGPSTWMLCSILCLWFADHCRSTHLWSASATNKCSKVIAHTTACTCAHDEQPSLLGWSTCTAPCRPSTRPTNLASVWYFCSHSCSG